MLCSRPFAWGAPTLFVSPRSLRASAPAAPFPPINVYESPEELVLTAELPGMRLEDIELGLRGNALTLRGERKLDVPAEGVVRTHRRERRAGRFERTFALPTEIDAEHIQAVYRHGILLVKLPKSPADKPRRIPVQPSSPAAGSDAAGPSEEATR